MVSLYSVDILTRQTTSSFHVRRENNQIQHLVSEGMDELTKFTLYWLEIDVMHINMKPEVGAAH